MKLKNFVAVALFAVAGSAFATSYNEPLDGDNNLGFPVGSQLAVTGLFSDSYTFDMPFSSNVVAGSVYSVSDPATVFSQVYLENTSTHVQTAFTMDDNSGSSWTLNETTLVAGQYAWHIIGNAPSETYYGGEISVTQAVPEPETYGMLLAGLGLVGFAARRRQSK